MFFFPLRLRVEWLFRKEQTGVAGTGKLSYFIFEYITIMSQ